MNELDERYEDGGRKLDETYQPMVFKEQSSETQEAIMQRSAAFFAHIKQTIGLSHLAQYAAEEANEWHENIDIVPLGRPGEKPVRMIHELRYYDEITVAAVIQDFRVNGSIAVSFSRHLPSDEQHEAAYGEVEALDSKITREAF